MDWAIIEDMKRIAVFVGGNKSKQLPMNCRTKLDINVLIPEHPVTWQISMSKLRNMQIGP